MTFEEWYKSRIWSDPLFFEACGESWSAAVEETKKACLEAVCNSGPCDGQCYEKPPGCEIYNAIMQAEVE